MTYNKEALNVIETLQSTINNEKFEDKILNIAHLIKKINNDGKITAIFGNGGSASDAQHFAAELVCTYKDRDRKPYRAIALTTDTSIITAWSNDFEYESIFARQLNAFENNIGLVIGLSTSGKSKNVLRALEYSKKINCTTCLICGKNELNYENVDFIIKVPSKDTGTIQTVTQVIYHSICQALENE